MNTNIEVFLRDKTEKMSFELKKAEDDFKHFWDRIDAEGDLPGALREWNVRHNKTEAAPQYSLMTRVGKKLKRIAHKLPEFVRDA